MKLKILIVGSSQCGKTSLANALGKENGGINTDGISSGSSKIPYYPTKAVRIVDFPMKIVTSGFRKETFDPEIQLWEIGGDPKLKKIWPGVQKDADGVIILYKCIEESTISDASALHMHFLTHSNNGLKQQQRLVIGNNFRGMRELAPQRIVGLAQNIKHLTLNIEDDTNQLKDEFQNFVSTIIQIQSEKLK